MITAKQVAEITGSKPNDLTLYTSAFTHRSYLNEHRGFNYAHNERLEFLGDAVLELVATEHLYKNYDHPEGELTNFRSALVNYKILSQIGRRIGLEQYILMSRGEAKDMGRARQVILANTIEALIGALYLDLGYEACKLFIEKEILKELPAIITGGTYLDPKSKLQEMIQDKHGITPTYGVLSESGPDHNKVFIVASFMGDKELGRGQGPSKQEGEIAAAENALHNLGA
ncbi:MAG TPA: ribonuclease III [Candidatus Doudnabacteria bacterium]|nr:ribonuclease III [Candidatus Doudnabacteria bacterium]